MNKAELTAAVADRVGISKQEANRAVDAVFGCIVDSMKNNEDVRIPGFGSFVVADRAARTGRNPQTGETMRIEASKQAKFKPGRGLQDTLNL